MSTMLALDTRGPGLASNKLCFRPCLHRLIQVVAVFIAISLVIEATPQIFPGSIGDEENIVDLPDKRPARLSYFRSPYSQSRGRYDYHGYRSRSYGSGQSKYDWWRKKAVNRYRMPWDNLPNTNCLRKYCQSDSDCCMRYSKCNALAHVCYDCWYGFPCVSNRDCCHKFPYCDPVRNTCVK